MNDTLAIIVALMFVTCIIKTICLVYIAMNIERIRKELERTGKE